MKVRDVRCTARTPTLRRLCKAERITWSSCHGVNPVDRHEPSLRPNCKHETRGLAQVEHRNVPRPTEPSRGRRPEQMGDRPSLRSLALGLHRIAGSRLRASAKLVVIAWVVVAGGVVCKGRGEIGSRIALSALGP